MDAAEAARAYYEHIDAADYEALHALLAPMFVHDRPDMTLEGREEFVSFMRKDRPDTDTSHAVDAVYTTAEGDGVVVEGRLLRGDGSEWFSFCDAFDRDGGKFTRLRTYTR